MSDEEVLRRMRERDRQLADHRAKLPAQPAALDELLSSLDLRSSSAEERSGALRRQRDEERLKRDLAEQRRAQIAQALAVLPPKYRQRLLSGEPIEQRPATVTALEWWRDAKHRVVLLRGGVGIGKSFAAGAIALECALSGKLSISWHRPNDFVSAVLHRYDPSAPKLGSDLVIVDDIGRETKADFEEAICVFLDDYETRLALTTNVRRDELAQRYDVRLHDRLRECCFAIGLKGESMRKGGGGF